MILKRKWKRSWVYSATDTGCKTNTEHSFRRAYAIFLGSPHKRLIQLQLLFCYTLHSRTFWAVLAARQRSWSSIKTVALTNAVPNYLQRPRHWAGMAPECWPGLSLCGLNKHNDTSAKKLSKGSFNLCTQFYYSPKKTINISYSSRINLIFNFIEPHFDKRIDMSSLKLSDTGD